MELIVKNVNIWDDYNLTINNTDFNHILLCGASGIGKTSIFNCIYFAITGLGFTNKWNCKNKRKTCNVTIFFSNLDLKIVRTLSPKSVEITYRGVIKTGDAAQVIIDDIFGPFHVLGYIKQKTAFSYFVSSSPRERMLYFEKILFNSLDIHDVKQRVKDKIDYLKTKYIEHKTILENHDRYPQEYSPPLGFETRQEILENISSKEIQLNSPPYKHCQTELLQVKAKFENINEQIHTKETDIILLKQQQDFLQEYIYQHQDNISKYKSLIQDYENNCVLQTAFEQHQSKIQINMQKIEKELSELTLIDLLELEKKIVMCQENIEHHELYQSYKEKIQDLGFCPVEYKKLVEQLNTMYINTNTCPNCDVKLNIYLDHVEICKDDNTNHDKIDYLLLRQQVDRLKSKEAKYKLLHEAMEIHHDKIMYPLCSNDELSQMQEVYKQQLQNRDRHVQLTEQLKQLSRYTAMTRPPKPKINEKKYRNYQAVCELYQSNIDKYELNKEIVSRLEGDLDKLVQQKQRLQDQIDTLLEICKEQQLLTRELNDFHEMVSLDDYNIRYALYRKSEQEHQDAIAFQTLLSKSISDVMMQTLSSVNLLVNKYLNGFFTNCKLEIFFHLDQNKNCIDIALSNDKSELCDLSILSGGEYDRVVLALSLSFAEYFKLPLLLLDEVMNSLDINTFNQVINHIQYIYPSTQTVLYIGHHLLKHAFDNIINLDEMD